MIASGAAVEAAQMALGCQRQGDCLACGDAWTDRGCATAVAVADAVAVIVARETLEFQAESLERRADAITPVGEGGDPIIADAYRFIARGLHSSAKALR